MKTLFTDRIVAEAKKLKRKICIPEAQFEPRVLAAAGRVQREGWLTPVLVGEAEKIKLLAGENKVDVAGLEIIEPRTSPDLDAFSAEYLSLRRKDNLSLDQARELMVQPVYFGAMLVRHELVDGMCAGAYLSTRDVLMPGLRIIGKKTGVKTVCSLCPVVIKECVLGQDIVLFLADCGVVPQPDSDQLAEITVAAADMVTALLGESPRTALLSFSTLGSASHPAVDKVAAAVAKVKSLRPDLKVDGEFQLDTAIIPAVAKRKAPDSPVAGKANLLILPNLDAANVAIKAIQWFAGGQAISTMILGLNGRVNDHTRGASPEEIALNMALTAFRIP